MCKFEGLEVELEEVKREIVWTETEEQLLEVSKAIQFLQLHMGLIAARLAELTPQ